MPGPSRSVPAACAGTTLRHDHARRQSPAESRCASAVQPLPVVAYQAHGVDRVGCGRPTTGTLVDVAQRSDGAAQHPDWSPDGTRLAFETDFATIWTVDSDGNDAVNGRIAAQIRASTSPGPCLVARRPRAAPSWRRRTRGRRAPSRSPLVRVVDLAHRHGDEMSRPTAPAARHLLQSALVRRRHPHWSSRRTCGPPHDWTSRSCCASRVLTVARRRGPAPGDPDDVAGPRSPGHHAAGTGLEPRDAWSSSATATWSCSTSNDRSERQLTSYDGSHRARDPTHVHSRRRASYLHLRAGDLRR